MVDLGGYVILLAEAPNNRIKLYGKYILQYLLALKYQVTKYHKNQLLK